MPKISVIMPFYNCDKFLDESISSILNQTFKNFEFIIINDASTDKSNDIVNKYLTDERIVYIKNKYNMGIVCNLNKGIDVAKSEIIARMDGDDISDLTRLEKQYDFLLNNQNISMVGCFVEVIDTNSQKINRKITKPTNPHDIKSNLFKFLTIVHGSIMIRKIVYSRIGKYRQKYLYSEDVDLTYRAIYGGFLGSNIPEFLYNYRYHSASTIHNNKIGALRAYFLRKAIIKELSLKINFSDIVFMYMQLFVGYCLSGRQRQFIEKYYKKFFVRYE